MSQVTTRTNCYLWYGMLVLPSFFLCASASAQRNTDLSANDLKKLSVEQLMNLEVTLVSRSPEKLTEAASAVQVISGEEIRNSGARNIAEALRLVANLQVAQVRSNAWLISARGFNALFANKLLVMIDGRTVYTPLFAGVLWDVQNVLLEDVDRIEVLSGPGGALWGANAVNGVINIITKSAAETQGLYISALGGSFVKDQEELRWGGRIGKRISYKVYGQHFDRNATLQPDGAHFQDAWKLSQGGFKMDWTGDKANSYTIQGDHYGGTVKSAGTHSDFNGQNVLGRWNKTFSEKSDMMLQLYYDRNFKSDGPGKTSDEMNTIDFDFQHRFPIARRHIFLWGAAYRYVRDNFASNTPALGILPQRINLDIANVFVQDEFQVAKKVKLTVGTKVLHNVYTGIEIQPSGRVAFSPDPHNTLWASVSRAVRTPSRVDVDYFAPSTLQPPDAVSVAGGPDFVSEKVLAYEAGYRVQPDGRSTFSISTFYNVYSDLYSLETLPGTLTYVISNGTEGKTWGAELAGTYQLLKTWRIRGGYTYFDKKIAAKPGHVFDPSYLANDAQNQILLQSMSDLPMHIHLDVIGRYLDYLPATTVTPKVPSYCTFDLRLAYTVKKIEVSVVGQNLATRRHIEFSPMSIPRSFYAKMTVRL